MLLPSTAEEVEKNNAHQLDMNSQLFDGSRFCPIRLIVLTFLQDIGPYSCNISRFFDTQLSKGWQ